MAYEQTKKQRASEAATRRFPGCELTIKCLIETDETFLEICDELAEAELALSRVDEAPPPLRSARRAEWQDLVNRLIGEVAASLRSDAAARPQER